MNKLANKIALITGGAAGIGFTTAETFLAEGATVVIWDINEEAGNNAIVQLNADKGKSAFQKVDVSDFTAVKEAVHAIIAQYGTIDILVNNAGITMDRTLLKMDPEVWQKVIDINLTGVFNCTRVCAEVMAEKGSGVILNASSVVGIYGNFGQTNYVAAKAGLIGMTKTWAKELGKKGIRVNAVAPGFIATEMVKKMPEQVVAGINGKTPLGRLGTPEDIAKAYLFLASDDASFITGITLSVDGGLTI
jgi:3-oxoacyl-[acyl-carrier protein] reductase